MSDGLFMRRAAARLSAALALSAGAAGRASAGVRLNAPNPYALSWGRIAPGVEVVLPPGDFRRPLIITAQGTAERPITIRAERPLLTRFSSSIIMQGARHVILRDILVEGAEHSGVIIQEGAEAITVEGCTVRASGLGIWIGNRAGMAHRLLNNRVLANATMGIAIDALNAAPGRETLIEGNEVRDNGFHGMEIHGNHYVVLRNRVDGNGRRLSGCSGIHTYCRDETEPHGKHNIIAWNISSGTKEPSGQDGNGIQADQWCDDNLIAFNVCFGNDGAGINVYDASRTGVFHNTLFGNMRDPGRSHVYPAELSLASDFTRDMARPRDNQVMNNIVVPDRAAVVALWVERTAASAPQEIGNNLFHHAAGGDLFFWGPDGWRGRNLARWNARKPGPADHVGDPRFADTAAPDGAGLWPRPSAAELPAPLPVERLRATRAMEQPLEAPAVVGALPPRG